ncbi:hypothetical protein [Luteimonas sp. gir]|uniref:hypothetical protein n=1 Tax=Luteimonas sp. gir TaxID=3127960 RepID=UPI003075C539
MKLTYSLALSGTDLFPERSVTVHGFKPEIDGADWLIVGDAFDRRQRRIHYCAGDGDNRLPICSVSLSTRNDLGLLIRQS